ncbi:MAG: N-6 DNA methylase [Ignavibacteriales bacterium]|nr:N-6 DNA methylase [Ignavibacteriales bacterium]
MSKKKLSLKKLETFLENTAEDLRGNMDASEFKEYIIAMMFLKRINDQFDVERETRKKILTEKFKIKETELEYEVDKNTKAFNYWIPENARWKNIKDLNEEVGGSLTKAFAAIEDQNLDKLEGVLKSIDFNRTIGKNNKRISDADLRDLIRSFNKISLRDEDLEFPDLMGAAYEYLIKYFADSSGKKGGEFYTPNEVVRLMVNLLEPKEDASIYDPTVGSGGMLIESKKYVEARYGEERAKNLSLYGQEKNGTTWSLCKMNMLFHGIYDADIRNNDTLNIPEHIEKGELMLFDHVLANPPFSQNYNWDDIKHKERFHFRMPSKGKADFMFVQHMVAMLKNNGRMAVVMPHGVLFRSGEEKNFRKWLIDKGFLEAVISLPPALFYGTGIEAAILIINKQDAIDRDEVLFINANREYKEGKVQNKLRPEDIEKISYIYRKKLINDKYSRLVKKEDLEKEEYNLNIRRYVDNSPPAEPHDVHAHLHGGIPNEEIKMLVNYFGCYPNLDKNLFESLKDGYSKFLDSLQNKENIKTVIEKSKEVKSTLSSYHTLLDGFWKEILSDLESLPEKKNIFDLNRKFSKSFAEKITKPNGHGLPVLDLYQSRGSFAAFWQSLDTDLKSVASSAWNAELIPDDEILESQFPEILKELRDNESRRDELIALFKEVNELDEGTWSEDEYEVWPKDELKEIKDRIKEYKAEHRATKREISILSKRITATEKVKQNITALLSEINIQKGKVEAIEKHILEHEARIIKHSVLETELKLCRKVIKEIVDQKDELVDQARLKITPNEAKELILARWHRTLHRTVDSYLHHHIRGLEKGIENLWNKYTIPLNLILSDREKETKLLDQFLVELGYE